MLFFYKATDKEGKEIEGSIDAASIDSAIGALQRRDLIIVDINPSEQDSLLTRNVGIFGGVKMKDVVILSRQISTLIGANVPVLTTFQLLASEAENPVLRESLINIIDDIQGGISIADALDKHPKIFSPFYVNMVRSAEESGRLPETFEFLADYLERSYELVRKAKNALVYPIFVIAVFILVMVLMLVLVIPQLTSILLESGQDIPIFTQIIIGVSNFFVSYGLLLLLMLVVFGVVMWRYARSDKGRLAINKFVLSVPYVGSLYQRLYLSRMSDNLNMMLESGIPMIRSIEVTAEVVDSPVYRDILNEVRDAIREGTSVSEAFSKHEAIPSIMIQMIHIGEETGKLGYVLKTLSRFYSKEVESSVDTLVSLIEPIMIVVLGVGVASLLAGILLPIYNLTGAF